MTRITKKPEERRAELIDTAEELFLTVGYNLTTVSDIVKKMNIAQGTFYYYFKSKEDILIAIFNKHLQQSMEMIGNVLDRSDLNSIEKYNEIIEIQFEIIKSNKNMSIQVHSEENTGIHQRIIINTINAYIPIYESLINQGIKEEIMNTKYPYEVSEFLLLITNFLFDPGLFEFTEEAYINKLDALNEMIMKTLKIPNKYINSFQIKEKAIELYKDMEKKQSIQKLV